MTDNKYWDGFLAGTLVTTGAVLLVLLVGTVMK